MYYSKAGPANTEKTVELTLKAADEKGIENIIVASNSGATALLFKDKGKKITCVGHVYGFKENGKNEMSDKTQSELKEAGIAVVIASHALSGVERGISNRSGGMYPAEIISNSMRMMGQGMKVCVEISIMALDAGAIPYGEKVLVVGGTGRGADTAAILTPAHAKDVFETKIHEIICKPH